MSYLSAVENKNISSYYIADIHQGSGEDYYQMQNTEEAAHFPYFPIFAISVLILSDYYPCNAPTPSYITSSYFIIYPDTGEAGMKDRGVSIFNWLFYSIALNEWCTWRSGTRTLSASLQTVKAVSRVIFWRCMSFPLMKMTMCDNNGNGALCHLSHRHVPM